MTDKNVVPIEEYERGARRRPRPATTTARAIYRTDFPPIRYVVPGYIAEGCTLLAGTPKLGKSWFCLEIALAVAAGGKCLGSIEVEQGPVLYLALEDNQRRLKGRLSKLWSLDLDAAGDPPEALDIATIWPRASEGGLEAIRAWIHEHPGARLVVVDVLQMFRPLTGNGREAPYESDFLAIKGLQQLASDTGVAVVIVHHTRKGVGDLDPFDAISGTLGLSGAADTALVLRRDSSGVTLYGRGRDIPEIETAVTFDRTSCRWVALGPAQEVRRTDERGAILEALRSSDDAMSPTEIAAVTGMSNQNVRQMLHRMTKAGEVTRASRGRYQHPLNPLSQTSQGHNDDDRM